MSKAKASFDSRRSGIRRLASLQLFRAVKTGRLVNCSRIKDVVALGLPHLGTHDAVRQAVEDAELTIVVTDRTADNVATERHELITIPREHQLSPIRPST